MIFSCCKITVLKCVGRKLTALHSGYHASHTASLWRKKALRTGG